MITALTFCRSFLSKPTTPRLCELTLTSLHCGWGVSEPRSISIPAYKAAPWATTSSGDSDRSGSLPVTRRSISTTMGMRVAPPTSRTRSIWSQVRPAWFTTSDEVVSVRSKRSRVMSSNCCRDISCRKRMPAWKQTTFVLAALRERLLGLGGVEPKLGGVLRIAPRIDAVGGLKLLGQVGHQPLVEIAAAKLHVAVGGQGAELRAVDLQHRHVERAAAQVVDQHAERLLRAAVRRLRKPCW